MKSPIAKSVTKRRKAAADARKSLARYVQRTTITAPTPEDEPAYQNARVTDLLWAKAFIEQALYLETSGQLGDELATPRRILSGITANDPNGGHRDG